MERDIAGLRQRLRNLDQLLHLSLPATKVPDLLREASCFGAWLDDAFRAGEQLLGSGWLQRHADFHERARAFVHGADEVLPLARNYYIDAKLRAQRLARRVLNLVGPGSTAVLVITRFHLHELMRALAEHDVSWALCVPTLNIDPEYRREQPFAIGVWYHTDFEPALFLTFSDAAPSEDVTAESSSAFQTPALLDEMKLFLNPKDWDKFQGDFDAILEQRRPYLERIPPIPDPARAEAYIRGFREGFSETLGDKEKSAQWVEKLIPFLRRCLAIGGEAAYDERERLAVTAHLEAQLEEARVRRVCYQETRDDRALRNAEGDCHKLLNHAGFDEQSPKFRQRVLIEAGEVYFGYYQTSGSADHLDRALQCWQVAVALAEECQDSDAHAACLGKVGVVFHVRYLRSANVANLADSLEFLETALRSMDRQAPQRPEILSYLADVLLSRYGSSGEAADLERAITLAAEANILALRDDPHRTRCLGSLGRCLLARYTRQGSLADLEQAVQAFQEARDLSASEAVERVTCLADLGDGLLIRWTRLHQRADLDGAVVALDEAVRLTLQGSPDRVPRLARLAEALRSRYDRDSNRTDLTKALGALSQAKALAKPDSPGQEAILDALSKGLLERHRRLQMAEDLQTAVELGQQAVEKSPLDSPGRPRLLTELARALRRRGQAGDLARATERLEEACRSGADISLEATLTAAREWGDWAFARDAWPESWRAYRYGLEASERLLQVQLVRRGKEAWLARHRVWRLAQPMLSPRTAICPPPSLSLSRAVPAFSPKRWNANEQTWTCCKRRIHSCTPNMSRRLSGLLGWRAIPSGQMRL